VLVHLSSGRFNFVLSRSSYHFNFLFDFLYLLFKLQAQFRQKGMLWRQKAKLAAKPMVGSILDHDRAARAEQLKRFHNLVAKVFDHGQ